MKIAFSTTVKQFEIANMLLARAVEELKAKPNVREAFGITAKDVEAAEAFRQKIVAAFTHRVEETDVSDTGRSILDGVSVERHMEQEKVKKAVRDGFKPGGEGITQQEYNRLSQEERRFAQHQAIKSVIPTLEHLNQDPGSLKAAIAWPEGMDPIPSGSIQNVSFDFNEEPNISMVVVMPGKPPKVVRREIPVTDQPADNVANMIDRAKESNQDEGIKVKKKLSKAERAIQAAVEAGDYENARKLREEAQLRANKPRTKGKAGNAGNKG